MSYFVDRYEANLNENTEICIFAAESDVMQCPFYIILLAASVAFPGHIRSVFKIQEDILLANTII